MYKEVVTVCNDKMNILNVIMRRNASHCIFTVHRIITYWLDWSKKQVTSL